MVTTSPTYLLVAFGLAASLCSSDDCDSSAALDIIFMADSSGSVFDPQFQHWQDEIDLVAHIVEESLPINSRAALINFAGCSSRFDVEQCIELGRIKKMIAFNDFGTPNDLQSLHSAIEAIGPADFLGGYTWTEEALQMALEEFNTNSYNGTQKMIVLITDGEPYPEGHEPCRNSTGYISPTLQELEELDVLIIAVGIDLSQDTMFDFFQCIVDDFEREFFYAADFAALAHLGESIGDVICDELSVGSPSSTSFP